MSLPLPIALLRRRARNAKSPKERHDTAYFAWEASLRIAAPRLALPEDLDIAAPAAGHFVRWLAARADDLTLDGAAILDCYGLLTEVGTEKRSSPRAVDAKKLLAALPPYRNRVLGHGSTRANDFYQSSADALLAGLDASWNEGVFFGRDEDLVFVESVELDAAGKRRARVLSLMGLASEADEVLDPPDDVRPSRVYARKGDAWTNLHPWVLFEGGELRERVLFFNGRTKGARFLDYVSGEELKGKPLGESFPEVDAELDAVLRSKPKPAAAAEPAEEGAFGDYRILGKLGEGGMGVVYLAEQKSLSRVVALKMLPAAAADDAIAVARFKREIAALSKCDHPNVAKILASGIEKGTHYYAMEFIDGVDLSQVSPRLKDGSDFDAAVSTASDRMREDKKELFASVPTFARARSLSKEPIQTTRALTTLFRDAALALQHIHEAGIIHRDVKPANLMVTTADHRLVLMDLGLAAMSNASKTLTRDASSVLGTLRYMPPEQLQRNLVSVDHRADVYALGATFYELLTGQPFFDGDSEARIIEQILRQEPVPPAKANPSLPRDLCVIVEKATRKEPKERYATASALAADLDAFLEGRAIAARPATLSYLLWLAVRRNKAIASAIALGIVSALVGTSSYLTHERALRMEAQTERAEAVRAQALADAMAIELLTEQGRVEAEAGAHGRALVLLAAAYEKGGHDVVLRELLARELRATTPTIVAGAHHGAIRALIFSTGGARVAAGGEDGVITIHDAIHGSQLRSLDAHAGAVLDLAFTDDGTRLLATYADGAARVWDAVRAEVMTTVKPDGDLHSADIRNDGTAILTTSTNGSTIWSVPTGTRVVDLVGHKGGVTTAFFDARDQQVRVLSGGEDGTARVWDAASGKLEATLEGAARVTDVSFVGEANVLTASDDGALTIWDLATKKPIHSIHVPRPVRGVEVVDASFDDDGKLESLMLRASRADGIVERWQVTVVEGAFGSKRLSMAGSLGSPILATGDGLLRATPTGGAVIDDDSGYALSRVDVRNQIVTATCGRSAWALGTDDGALLLLPRATQTLGHVDGSHVRFAASRLQYEPFVYASDSALVWGADLVDAHGGATLVDMGDHQTKKHASARPDLVGALVATADGVLRVLDTRVGKIVVEIPDAQSKRGELPASVALSTDGTFVAAALDDRTSVYRVAGGEKVRDLGDGANMVMFADAHAVITCRSARCAKWDVTTGTKLTEYKGHDATIMDAALNPDHTRLVTASTDGTARVWDVASGGTIATLRGHGSQVLRAAFSPDGSFIATTSADGTAKIWDAEKGTLRTSLDDNAGAVYALAVARDGIRVITGAASGRTTIWDVRSGKPIERLELGDPSRGATWIVSVEISPDGSSLATELADGTIVVEDLPLESRSADEVRKLVEARDLPWRFVNGQLVNNGPLSSRQTSPQ